MTISSSHNVPSISSIRKAYSCIVPASVLVNIIRIRFIKSEPTMWNYSGDSTADSQEITLTNYGCNYNNANFGDIAANNIALIFI